MNQIERIVANKETYVVCEVFKEDAYSSTGEVVVYKGYIRPLSGVYQYYENAEQALNETRIRYQEAADKGNNSWYGKVSTIELVKISSQVM